MNVDLARERSRIDNIFALTSKLNYDEELVSHWARYLCVLTSGMLEQSLRIMLSDYATRHANDEVARHSHKHVQRLTNLNNERLCELLGSFSAEWRKAFEASVRDEQKAAVDSLVANRNEIVHGRNVGITINRVRDYYKRSLEVVEWIRENCAKC